MLDLLKEKNRREKQLNGMKNEIQTWRDRLALAKQHERPDLISAAEEKLAELEARLPGLENSFYAMDREIKDAKHRLKDAQIDDERGLNRAETDALVAGLESAAGFSPGDPNNPESRMDSESRRMDAELKDAELDDELEQLRKKLK